MFYIKGSIVIYNYLFASYLYEFAYIKHKKERANTFILLFSIMCMQEYKDISLFADTHYICISVSYKFFRGKNKFNLIFIIRYLSHTLYKTNADIISTTL